MLGAREGVASFETADGSVSVTGNSNWIRYKQRGRLDYLRTRIGMTENISDAYYLTCFVYLFLCQAVLWRAVKCRKFNFVVPVALITDSLLMGFLLVEIVLSTGIFDGDYRWTPLRFQREDKKIAVSHQLRAQRNSFGFNDDEIPVKKAVGTRRIVLLGDSFIFGDGLPREETWGIKLRKLISSHNPSVEVLLWGRNGWSTRGELEFLKRYGILFKPDILIVAFVTNDPSPCEYDCVYRLAWQDSPILEPIKTLFPESINFISSFVNRLIESHSNFIGYENYENALYSERNLASYSATLFELSQFSIAHHLPVLIVLTPNDYSKHFQAKYGKIKPLMSEAKLPVLDLSPAVAQALGDIPIHRLRASRANGHPGSLLTSLYADEVFKYLKNHKLVDVQ